MTASAAAATDATDETPMPLCASDALAERGDGVLFDLLLWGQPARGFALRVDGRVVAYVNRCAHVPVELDWQPGRFMDAERQWIICAVHGAAYDPATGRCFAGPCGRGGLIPIRTAEADGRVHWYASADVRPVPAASGPLPESPA